MSEQRFELKVNGRIYPINVDPTTPLLYVLRDELELDGPHFGCGLAQCGACTVQLESVAIRSCVLPVSAVGTQEVTTIEGLAVEGKMSALQAALVDAQAPQCGYCMSGITMSASALLKQTPHPTDAQIRQALDGNLCRCGTHARVLRAVKAASGSAT
jgi:aerobic-type carbon monoxide dehydrogenase small subunit (CoxS/CutS family)